MYTPTDKHEAAGSSGQILPGSGIPVAVLRKLAAELRRAHSGKLSPEIVAAAVASLLPAPTPERYRDHFAGSANVQTRRG